LFLTNSAPFCKSEIRLPEKFTVPDPNVPAGLDAIEALTPKPQGDVSLWAIKEVLGDDLWLMDGVAILFDETFSVEELEAQVRECIELFAAILVLGVSDEMSSTGDIERMYLVQKIADDYNAAQA